VYDFITNELGITGGHQGDRSIINPFELDMVFPDHKIAVEYCGLYWHSEASSGKGRDYHYNKMLKANKKGYRLITIFSDEWNLKRDAVKSKLMEIFRENEGDAKVVCVKPVSYTDYDEFVATNQLNTRYVSGVRLGVFIDDALSATMLFKKDGVTQTEYEIIAFTTNGKAPQNARKLLLNEFIKTNSPTKIAYNVDLRRCIHH
jgi:very-short-patch-repair endonuclease